MPFSINGRNLGTGYKPYFVAEMSGNHNNDINRALKIIDAAKKAGADAVKLQTYTASTITIDHSSDEFIVKGGLWNRRKLFDLYSEASTPWEWHEKLFEHAQNIGISIFSTPFDFSAVDFLEKLSTPLYKIASPEIVDLPLISKVCDTGKPIILSSGAASIDEISEAISFIKSKNNNRIMLLHCTASYPAPLVEANLSTINFFKDKFQVEVGLSDHTLGTIVSATAVSLGASLIEKHFTLSREEGGIDSAFSLEPKEFELMVNNSLEAFNSIGSPKTQPTKSEALVQRNKRSLYVVKDVKKGDNFTHENIRSIRPSKGIKPKYYYEVLGKKATRNIKYGDPLKEDMIENFSLIKSSLNKFSGNILVTSCSNKNSLVRCLKNSIKKLYFNSKVYVADSNRSNLAKFDADFFWHMPLTKNKNIDEIISFCVKNNIKFIFPTRDGELLFWSNQKKKFELNNIFVIVSPPKVINKCFDKIKFFDFCNENGFKTIDSFLEINKANFDYFVVKERFGSGGKNIGLKLNKSQAKNFAKKLKNPIFQPYFNLKEISIDCWVSKNGDIPGVTLRYRDLVVNGEAKVTSSFEEKNIEEEAISFISKMGIIGPAVIQAFLMDNRLIFIECNPRFGGASTLAVKDGLDIFTWSIRDNLETNYNPIFIKSNSKITQIRTEFDNIYYDLNF